MLSDKAAGLRVAQPDREGRGLGLHRRQCLLQSRDAGLGRFRVIGKRLPEAGFRYLSAAIPARWAASASLSRAERDAASALDAASACSRAAISCCPRRRPASASPSRAERDAASAFTAASACSRAAIRAWAVSASSASVCLRPDFSARPAGFGCRKTPGKGVGFRYGRRKSVLQRRDVLLPGKVGGLGVAKPGREGRGLGLHRRQCLLQSRDAGLGRFRVIGKRLPEVGDLLPALGPAGFGCRKTPGKGVGFRYGRRKSVLQRRDVLLPGKVGGLGVAQPGREGRGLGLHRRQCLLQSRDAGLGRFRVIGKRLPEVGNLVPSLGPAGFGCRKTPGKGVGFRHGRRKSVLQRRDVLLPGKVGGLGVAKPGRAGPRGTCCPRRRPPRPSPPPVPAPEPRCGPGPFPHLRQASA